MEVLACVFKGQQRQVPSVRDFCAVLVVCFFCYNGLGVLGLSTAICRLRASSSWPSTLMAVFLLSWVECHSTNRDILSTDWARFALYSFWERYDFSFFKEGWSTENQFWKWAPMTMARQTHKIMLNIISH